MSLVKISQTEHGVIIDLKYATHENFTGAPVYARAECYLHAEAASALRRAVELATPLGFVLRVYDAYRPTEAQQKLWDHTPDPNFLADPAKGSPHSRGVAIDLTLCRKDGTPLDMGTPFDTFSPLSHHGRTDISPDAQANRLTLLGLMTAAGWDFYRNEWWHYQLFKSREYPLVSDGGSAEKMLE